MELFEILSIHNKTLESSDSSEFSVISEFSHDPIAVESGLPQSSPSGGLHSSSMPSTSSLSEEEIKRMLFELVEDNRLLRESLQSSSAIMKSELCAIASWHSNITSTMAQHQISLQAAQARVQELEGEKAQLLEKLQSPKDTLVGLTKRVANGIKDLVQVAKKVVSKCSDDPFQKRVILVAQCVLSASQFVACAKVVAPTISNPTCQQQQQLIEAAKELSRAVEGINKTCHDATRDEKLLHDIGKASGQVDDALNDLVNEIETASALDGALDTILDATDGLFSSTGNAGKMVRQDKILAMIESMKNICEENEKENNVLKSKLVNQEGLNSKSHELLLNQAEEHLEKIKTLKKGNEKVVKELEAKVKELEVKLNLELQASDVRRIKHQEDKKLLSVLQSHYDNVAKQLKMQSRKQEQKTGGGREEENLEQMDSLTVDTYDHDPHMEESETRVVTLPKEPNHANEDSEHPSVVKAQELEDASYQSEEWFHGVLPREEVVRHLVNDGDFLVREMFHIDTKQVVLSVFSQGYKHFIVQMTSERKYRFMGSDCFNTIKELIMHQFQSGKPVMNTCAILRRPIPREKWDLRNEAVN